MKKRYPVVCTVLLSLSFLLTSGCKTQNLKVTNAKLDVANACDKIYGGDPFSFACKDAKKRLAEAQANKVVADEYDRKVEQDRASYETKFKDSPAKARFAEEIAQRQSTESVSRARQFPKLEWLTETWCETKAGLGDIETRSYRIMEEGAVRWAGYIEPIRPMPQRGPYTVVNDYRQVRVLSDTDVELWLHRLTDSAGLKTIVHLSKKSSKLLVEVSYRTFEFPKNGFQEDHSLIGGTPKVNNTKAREFKRCKWKPI